MSNDKTPSPTSFEASLSELEAIVKEMESGELPLNEALEKFERGIALSRQSQQVLAQAEQKVRILLQEQGQETLRDLSEDSELK
ncbi:exodeoxyribonuclease VII small subunit [Aestuariibacter sp. A3R04]|uniref:exodeoxyribonuclease VII small subunit n=1 Tax=Aestuariibacter sp. A3R04 TaxID=2841571 RepID=UPI001C0A3E0E|nr:exodeoxyribonuclease VII small subunit [Aestuariibacter sp. A3R04]